jgi:hypothetical protein
MFRFLFIFILLNNSLNICNATTMHTDTVPMPKGLGVKFGLVTSRFFYDGVEIREVGAQQKLSNFNKKALKNYNMGQLIIGLGGASLALLGITFVISATDGAFAISEKREGYQNAWQLPVYSLLGAAVSLLVIEAGKNSVRIAFDEHNKSLGSTSSVAPKIEVGPASSGVGVAIRF